MSAATVDDHDPITGQPSVARVLIAVAGVTTVCVSPAFLVGGLGVQLQSELGFGAAVLGLSSAGFFCVAATASRVMGGVVERLGARPAIRLAVAISCVCLLGLALSKNVAWMITVLCSSGVANALGQPAANVLVTQGVPAHRRGMGFGVKQSAIPAATTLAGASVPAVALTVGWRWAFVIMAGIGVIAVLMVPRLPDPQPSRHTRRADSLAEKRNALLLIAVAGALASGAANALGAFLTTTAVDIGFSPSAAGVVLSVGSVSGLSVRLLAGVLADRKNPNLLNVIRAMLFFGAGGFVLIAVPLPAPFLLGVAIAFCAGWSWPGLLNFAITKIVPDRVATATSITQSGVYVGAGLGPLAFGFLAEHLSLRGAWLVDALVAVVAAVLLLFVRHPGQGAGLRATPP